jgi:hypothetical protein
MVRHKFCKKYTSAAVAHSARDITPRLTAVGAARSGPLAWPRRGAARHGVRGLAPRDMAAAGLLAPWATALGSGCLYNSEIQPKMS